LSARSSDKNVADAPIVKVCKVKAALAINNWSNNVNPVQVDIDLSFKSEH